MKRCLAAIALLALVSGLVMAQEGPAITFNKGLAECSYSNPLDKVWSAAVKTFMTQKPGKGGSWQGSPVRPDKTSNTMSGTWVVGKGLTQWAAELQLLFEEDGASTKIYCTVAVPGIGKKNREKVQTQFLAALFEMLK